MSRFYTGIGSRETPLKILDLIKGLALKLGELGYILRSGGADGADSAFEKGHDLSGISKKEIYLPWPLFNKNPSRLCHPSREAFEMAKKFHPAWDRCSQGAQKLHARNCHQVLGQDLKTPSIFVVCWTKNGGLTGGTAQALRIAQANNIEIFNLWFQDDAITRLKRRVGQDVKRGEGT